MRLPDQIIFGEARATSTNLRQHRAPAGGWEELARRANFRAGTLARLCGVSIRTLQRHFKERYEMTLTEWLRGFRLEQARLQLLSGEGVKQVAFDLGYKQLSHFSRAFKERFGVPPRLLARNGEHSAPAPQPAAHLQ